METNLTSQNDGLNNFPTSSSNNINNSSSVINSNDSSHNNLNQSNITKNDKKKSSSSSSTTTTTTTTSSSTTTNSSTSSAASSQSSAVVQSNTTKTRVGCAHYKRRAKFVTPCCNKFYMCRYCHDENESHYFNRKTVTELICTECDTRQRVQAECEKCGVRFGKYTCLICNLFDDEDKNQYHCDGCGICRVGGKGRFFHCEVCNMCLPLQLKISGHRCVENVSRSNCPVCLEDIHTSRIPCHIPDCGHLLHRTCFEELLSSGHYACPTCQTSMMDMKQLWDYLDAEVLATPMPKEYENYTVDILCKDCHKESTVKFHVVGLKCTFCGAYNTCRTKGSSSSSTGTTPTNGESSGSSNNDVCGEVHSLNGNDEA